MGPGFESPEDSPYQTDNRWDLLLQWGRASRARKTVRDNAKVSDVRELQWDRAS